MATLFEKYRRIEAARCEVLAGAADRYSVLISRIFERVSVKEVAE